MAKSPLAVELARLSEEATPSVLAAVLEKFWACGNCGLEKDSHPQKDCRTWVAGFGMKDGLELLDRLTEFSLHEAKVEDALGLKKKGDSGATLVFMPHITEAEWKKMTREQRQNEFLKGLSAAPILDIETTG